MVTQRRGNGAPSGSEWTGTGDRRSGSITGRGGGMKKSRLVALALAPLAMLALVASPVSAAPRPATVRPEWNTLPTPTDGANQLFHLLNALRVSKGVAPLQRISGLDDAGAAWSTFMANGGCLARGGTPLCHRTDLATIATDAAPSGWTSAGENVGYVGDNLTMTDMHNKFVSSPGHYANMINPNFNEVGIGMAISANGVAYVTEEFVDATPLPNFGGGTPPSSIPAPPAGTSAPDAFRFYLNYFRGQAHLPKVAGNVVLDRETAYWSQQMVNGACGLTLWCHRRDLTTVMRAAFGPYGARWWSETMGSTMSSDALVQVRMFLNSPANAAILMSARVNALGVGLSSDGTGRLYLTLDPVQARYPASSFPRGGTCGWVTSTLAPGATGPLVRVAQCAIAKQIAAVSAPLRAAAVVEVNFGPSLARSIKAFQAAHRLRASGVLDYLTRRLLAID